MNPKRLLLCCGMLLICNLVLQSMQIAPDDARLVALDFLKQKNPIKCTPNQQNQLTLSYVAQQNGESTFYVYNILTGGYIVVSANDYTKNKVLGYSLSGEFNYENLTPECKSWFDKYSERIASCSRETLSNLSKSRASISSETSTNSPKKQIQPVSPLLGQTEWGQMWPYNTLCPVISGHNAPTGCVITAYAQIMRYYEWPLNGTGQHSYQWNNKTLSADFSKSEYDWVGMKDSYDSNSDDRSINAVACLMRDLGVAFDADYSLSGTGASDSPEPLVSYFGYAADTGWMVGDYVSSDLFESTIIDELSNDRPVEISGFNPQQGGHAFVCDGVDENGYFHINFGWGGGNGYFLLSATGYVDNELWYHIRPADGKILPTIDYISLTNHFKYSENVDKLQIAIRKFGKWHEYKYILALENISTGEIIHLNEFQIQTSESYHNIDINLNNIEDGEYRIYPLYRDRKDDSAEWNYFEHNEKYQGYVEVHVTNGNIKFINPLIPDTIDSGTVKIDNIYYKLDEINHLATVTYKNSSYDSYAGDIIIPESVIYENEQYRVTTIGKYAFHRCPYLRSVTLPTTVKQIEYNGIGFSALQTLRIPKDSQLDNISSFGMESNSVLVCLKLPDDLTTLGSCAFQRCYRMQYVSLPASYKYKLSSSDPFHLCEGLKSIRLGWSTPINITSDFFGIKPDNIKVYVPIHSKEIYETQYWGAFPIFEYFSNDNCFYSQNEDGTLTLIDGDKASEHIEILPSIKYPDSNVNKKITQIGHCAFYANNDLKEIILPSTISYIGDYAFANCENLSSIVCKSFNPPIIEENKPIYSSEKEWDCLDLSFRAFYGVDKEKCFLYVPMGSREKYLNAPEWKDFENIIEEDFSGIGDLTEDKDLIVTFKDGAIEIYNLKEHQLVEIYNPLGQMVYRGFQQRITGINKGIYIVKINNMIFKGCI